ncbi:hypothetical protein HN51_058689, partial [Arachis hypogaea]
LYPADKELVNSAIDKAKTLLDDGNKEKKETDVFVEYLTEAPPPATLTAAVTFSVFSSFLNTEPVEHSPCLSRSFSFAESSSSSTATPLSPFIPLSSGSHTFAQALAPWRPKSVPPSAAVPPLSFPLFEPIGCVN